jgi:hypothetical protein
MADKVTVVPPRDP